MGVPRCIGLTVADQCLLIEGTAVTGSKNEIEFIDPSRVVLLLCHAITLPHERPDAVSRVVPLAARACQSLEDAPSLPMAHSVR